MEKITQQQQEGGISGEHGQSSKGMAPSPSSDLITILIKSQDGVDLFYKIPMERKLKKLLTAYCIRRDLLYETVRFFIDGQRVDHEKTPKELGLEDGDQIDAMLEQSGGGKA